MLETKKDYAAGLRYIDQSLALKQDWYNVWIKALLYAGKGDYKAAEKGSPARLRPGRQVERRGFSGSRDQEGPGDWGQKSLAAR